MEKSDPWTIKDLDYALRDLKNNKSKNFEGYANEIFKNEVIGSDLLIMCNNLKEENYIPQFMNYADVTTVPKSGSKLEPVNKC